MHLTYLIILITAAVSIPAFDKDNIKDKLMLWPAKMDNNPKEYYRLFTCSLVHADWQHLIFNMITLFFFGLSVELTYAEYFNKFQFLMLYIIGVITSSLPALIKHRHHYHYRALGASGGVSAILFASIFFYPWATINFIIPGILYGVFYLYYSAHMARHGRDNIGHDAHFWGAIAGVTYTILLKPSLVLNFFNQLMHPHFF